MSRSLASSFRKAPFRPCAFSSTPASIVGTPVCVLQPVEPAVFMTVSCLRADDLPQPSPSTIKNVEEPQGMISLSGRPDERTVRPTIMQLSRQAHSVYLLSGCLQSVFVFHVPSIGLIWCWFASVEIIVNHVATLRGRSDHARSQQT